MALSVRQGSGRRPSMVDGHARCVRRSGLLRQCFSRASGAAEPLAPVTAEELRAEVRALGAKAVLVNAWATWCDSCQNELPTLQKLADRWAAQGVRILLVSIDEPEDR